MARKLAHDGDGPSESSSSGKDETGKALLNRREYIGATAVAALGLGGGTVTGSTTTSETATFSTGFSEYVQ